MFTSYLFKDGALFLKLAAGLCTLAIMVYLNNDPIVPPNGGTLLGYTYGILGAIIIIWLLWFGVRKRQYTNTRLSLSTWLASHVYLGIVLLVIATLHTGFIFGLNVHTVSYVFMILTITSGFYGVYAYIVAPMRMSTNIADTSEEVLLNDIKTIDQKILNITKDGNELIHQFMIYINSNIFNHKISRRYLYENLIKNTDSELGKKLDASIKNRRLRFPDNLMSFFRSFKTPTVEQRLKNFSILLIDLTEKDEFSFDLQLVIELMREKAEIVDRLENNMRYKRMMKAWLLLHIPLSIGLLVTLIIHIISVLFY